VPAPAARPEASERPSIEEPGEEPRGRWPASRPREDLVFPFVHESGLSRIMVVVPDQVQEPVHEEQIHLERERDTDTRSLPRGRVGGDDHLAEQP